ncbi:MAG: hypothetical protein K8W52_27405 [Deltaproteobacteria bacterium]|nr:hypothetical protein [Deltaproteobacteria bacterium]
MTQRTIYVFGNGRLSFEDFLRLYVPALEPALAQHDTAWVVGDFRGVDTLVMEYLKARTAAVTVFHVGERPRYLPDRHGALAAQWQLRGGFANDRARDEAAIAACTHFLAIDRFSLPQKPTATAALIERCRAAGKLPIVADVDRAVALGRVRAEIDRADVHATAKAFARILIELFPPWFTFAPEQFAVLTWSMGLHLVASGPSADRRADVMLITTSDSRQMRCAVHASWAARGETATIGMHYEPSDAHRERARTAIALAMHALHPGTPIDPDLAARVPPRRVFPDDLA